MKKILLSISFLWMMTFPFLAAEQVPQLKDETLFSNAAVSLKATEHIVVNDIPAKTFTFNVNNSGAYYLSAWINVPEYADKTFPTYTIYNSARRIGTITPKESGWQVCVIDGSATVDLAEGENQLMVISDKKDVPDIHGCSNGIGCYCHIA